MQLLKLFFVCFQNKPLIEKIVVLQIEGLSPSTFHFLPALASPPPASLSLTEVDPTKAVPTPSNDPFAGSKLGQHLQDCRGLFPALASQFGHVLHIAGSLFSPSSVTASLLTVKNSDLEPKKKKKGEATEAPSEPAEPNDAAWLSMASSVATLTQSGHSSKETGVPAAPAPAASSAEPATSVDNSSEPRRLPPISHYCLSELELAQNKYPILLSGQPPAGFIEFQNHGDQACFGRHCIVHFVNS